MQPRVFHITDFPEKLSILLKKDFRENFIDFCIEKAGGKGKLGEYLGIKKLHTINRWRKASVDRGNGWATPQFMPLSRLLILQRLVSKQISIEDIEKNIEAIKARGPGNLIKNPNLPLVEDERIVRIIVHLIGDGFAKSTNTQFYRNTDENLKKEFMKDLEVFGQVEAREKDTFVFFPICITHILKKIYNVDFMSKTARIPKFLFQSPESFISSAIRAFADDEGCVSDNGLTLYSCNKPLLDDFKKLIKENFPTFAIVTEYSRERPNTTEHSFTINQKSLVEFNRLIGFSHLKKKEDVEFYLRKRKRNWNHRNKWETKNLILKSLLESPKTTKKLAKELMVSLSMISNHINGYKKRGKHVVGLMEKEYINLVGKYKSERIWELTEEGRKFLINNDLVSK
ncbi:MAG: ArsR family transcriptional regulator [Candidatus Aenigmarchaeota archaeon]|nr:ArsR family transcriptional regulator [Candidatus Aenigmarchaeota archaeon]